MASYTTNLNLKKPAGSENVAIGDINGNMDTIDTAYGALNKHGSADLLATGNNGTTYTNKELSHPMSDYRYIIFIYIGETAIAPATFVTNGNFLRATPKLSNDVFTATVIKNTDNSHVDVVTSQGSQWYLYGIK